MLGKGIFAQAGRGRSNSKQFSSPTEQASAVSFVEVLEKDKLAEGEGKSGFALIGRTLNSQHFFPVGLCEKRAGEKRAGGSR